MSAPTLDQTATTGTTVVPRRRGWVGPFVAVLVGAILAAGTTWLVVSVVSLDITPAAVGW